MKKSKNKEKKKKEKLTFIQRVKKLIAKILDSMYLW